MTKKPKPSAKSKRKVPTGASSGRPLIYGYLEGKAQYVGGEHSDNLIFKTNINLGARLYQNRVNMGLKVGLLSFHKTNRVQAQTTELFFKYTPIQTAHLVITPYIQGVINSQERILIDPLASKLVEIPIDRFEGYLPLKGHVIFPGFEMATTWTVLNDKIGSFSVRAQADSWLQLYEKEQYFENKFGRVLDNQIKAMNRSGAMVQFDFNSTPKGLINFGAFFDYRHLPRYVAANQIRENTREFKWHKNSFYRFRGQIQLFDNFLLINDLYQIFDGHFKKETVALTNIIRAVSIF